jgi:hypothetical protein
VAHSVVACFGWYQQFSTLCTASILGLQAQKQRGQCDIYAANMLREVCSQSVYNPNHRATGQCAVAHLVGVPAWHTNWHLQEAENCCTSPQRRVVLCC